ncbi:MAG: peptidase T [candidate division KSB1 bacterium]|nr:peptidase T [candidate division KSB1 bacterium]MDZ7319057.1 peptidase T [candidate division KSB1 bacterium]
MSQAIEHTVVDRFLKYVKYDTQSAEDSPTYPSTEKQKILGQVLVAELKEMGLSDAAMDEHGYVMATLAANIDKPVPTIGLIAHMDTSPDVSGADVKPIIHYKYQGGDIVLAGDPSQILRMAENPDLAEQIGNDIITSDGTTLLGADNKAGIAEIFDAIHHLVTHPEIKHGRIRIAITPDEEVGGGTKYFDIKKFGADYAYTIDGERSGDIDDETFCADSVNIKIIGKNVHPGYAKNKMINAIKIAAQLIARLPQDRLSPETTEKREGYVHPNSLSGGVEATTIKFIIRDFTVEGLKQHEAFLKQLADEVMSAHPQAKLEFAVEESYRNMKYKLDENPKVVEYAMEAVRRSGLTPRRNMIRGGTDGSRLCYEGLLTPNIFTGGHNFHSKLEWISVQDMQKAVEVVVNLIQIWAEK